jgi:Cu/Ag efflux protein CusF
MKTRRALALTALAAALACPVAAQQKSEAKKPIVEKETQSITATVEAIDAGKRELTLKGPKGNFVVIAVPDSVKRFPEIKVGDELAIQYTEAVVVELKKAQDSAKLGTTEQTSGQPTEGAKPGAFLSRKITTTVAVEAVDPAAPSITVRQADGDTLSFRVRDRKNLEGVKPGDKIVLTYVEAVAVQVSAPPAKK